MEPLFVLLIATKYKEKWNQLCHTLHDIQFNQFWQEFNFFLWERISEFGNKKFRITRRIATKIKNNAISNNFAVKRLLIFCASCF